MNTLRSFSSLTDGTITLKDGSSIPFYASCTRTAPEAIRVALGIEAASHPLLKKRGVVKATLGSHTIFDFSESEQKDTPTHFDQRPVTKDRSRHPFAGAPAFA